MTIALYWIAGSLLSAAALLALYRIVRGPSLLDRVIASDVMLTTLILVVGAEMVINDHSRTVPVMLAIAAVAVFGNIAVVRSVAAQDRAPSTPADAPEAGEERP